MVDMRYAQLLVCFLIIGGCSSLTNRGTYDLFLIPKNYEGVIKVLYNVEGAPTLQREGKYDIIPVDENGMYHTSTPIYDAGRVINQYYYVDGKGNRTEIDSLCVHGRGTGNRSNGTGGVTHYTEIEVTHSACGEDFAVNGSSR